jgi:hypothetical protein
MARQEDDQNFWDEELCAECGGQLHLRSRVPGVCRDCEDGGFGESVPE